ncbi:site-specific DNA-methyltransferase [Paenibacillus oceani]|uniref:Site-specific DNA-methyltransferase n=1 Tax=Paenibacillus oceani TaxID=2772510 RepID=A0A927GZQ4_9BACL|nr:site-specific DNA-methyltransferase [Paenibacillus oceani]MBD2862488.1 site-specific DNA-methyltransferase [Paenibacillus oceani]
MNKFTTDDSETKSIDIVSENIGRLKELFPEAFIEGKINFEVLKQLLSGEVEEREEKYGLNWHGKRQARQLALTPSAGTLRPCPEDSVDWENTKNLLIEGDNLEVLKLLQKSYANKVKLIYIDPPYNTGKDFVYPDDFRDNIKNYQEITGQLDSEGKKISSNSEASGRFHTDWLNMIYPRIKLARNLLREDGLILISLDDKEINNMRHICNEVFGEENLVACLIWEKGRKNDAKFFSIGHEYMLVFAKSLTYLRELKTVWREEKPGAREIWEKYIELRAVHGADDRSIESDLQEWYSDLPNTHPSKKWSRYKRIDENGPWRDRDISWPGGGGPRYDLIHPVTKLPCKVPERGWIYSSLEEMQRQIKLGLVEFRQDHTEPPFRKAHIKPISIEGLDEMELDEEEEVSGGDEEFATQVRGSYFYKQSQVAVKHLRKLMGAKIFNNPKDHVELAKLFDYTSNADNDAIVMDFFAGSGTTGHSVMELNAADMGNRRFILVQLPEPLNPLKKEQKASANFCDKLVMPRTIAELTKERLRRAASEIKAEKPEFTGDLGFRVFKLDSSNIRTWEPDTENLGKTLLDHLEHIRSDRNENDILYEVLLKLGLDLCVPIETRRIAGKLVHAIGAGVLLVCLDMHISQEEAEPLATGIVKWYRELIPAGKVTCVFRDSAFADDVTKTNLAAILQQNGLDKVRSL